MTYDMIINQHPILSSVHGGMVCLLSASVSSVISCTVPPVYCRCIVSCVQYPHCYYCPLERDHLCSRGAGAGSSAAQPPVPLFSHYSATALLALIINIFKQHFILCHPSFLVSFVSGEFDKYVVQHALMRHTCMQGGQILNLQGIVQYISTLCIDTELYLHA